MQNLVSVYSLVAHNPTNITTQLCVSSPEAKDFEKRVILKYIKIHW